MFYIHQAACISPQETFDQVNIDHLHPVTKNELKTTEPTYKAIPGNLLRRMSKSVRMSVGALLSIIGDQKFDGVIIGTANAGMEESGKFLSQIVEYDEDTLSPGNFVQSTSNAIAAQISLMFGNTGYNSTHVHKGHSFENAMIDAAMLVTEHPDATYILGGVDEIASNNYQLDQQKGWFKSKATDQQNFYQPDSAGTIPGEGAAVFLVNNKSDNALAHVTAIEMIHTADEQELAERVREFLSNSPEKPDLILSGENGDSNFLTFINAVENETGNVPIARFKHMSGEYPTASSFSVWLATALLSGQAKLSPHMMKSGTVNEADLKTILIYNMYQNVQHSLIRISKV